MAFDEERKDINTRALIDRMKEEFRPRDVTLNQISETLKELKKEVGVIDVRVERLLVEREHVVTTGKLMGILGVSFAVIVGGAWGVAQAQRAEMNQDNRELRIEVMGAKRQCEARADEIQKLYFRKEQEATKGRRTP